MASKYPMLDSMRGFLLFLANNELLAMRIGRVKNF